MLPLTEEALRASFINASLRERQNLSVPSNFDELDWNGLDFSPGATASSHTSAT